MNQPATASGKIAPASDAKPVAKGRVRHQRCRVRIPDDRSALPGHPAPLPDDRAALPGHRAALPDDRAALLGHRAALLNDRAALPDDPAAFLDDRAALPDDPAPLPDDRERGRMRWCAVPSGRKINGRFGGWACRIVECSTEHCRGRRGLWTPPQQPRSGDS